MRKSQVIKQFEVQTDGSCFMCFKEIISRGKLTDKDSSDDSDTDTDDEGDGGRERKSTGEPKRMDTGNLISLHRISRYLELNMKNVFNGETTTIPVQLLATVQRSELKVSLCRECSDATGKCSVVVAELEKVKMQVDLCLKTFLGRLLIGERDDRAKQGYWDRIVRNPQAVMHTGIVEKLRKETVKKCSNKVKAALPQVSLKRLDQNYLSGLARKSGMKIKEVITIKKGPSTSTTANFHNSLLEEISRVIPKKSLPDKDKQEAQRGRPINEEEMMMKMSSSSSSCSSSSSESDPDDDIVAKLRIAATTRPRSVSVGSSLSNYLTNYPLFHDWLQSSTTTNCEESFEVNPDVQIAESPSSKDDPVKKLYPFKCAYCRKRFKTQDKLISHDHPSANTLTFGVPSPTSSLSTSMESLKSDTEQIKLPVRDSFPHSSKGQSNPNLGNNAEEMYKQKKLEKRLIQSDVKLSNTNETLTAAVGSPLQKSQNKNTKGQKKNVKKKLASKKKLDEIAREMVTKKDSTAIKNNEKVDNKKGRKLAIKMKKKLGVEKKKEGGMTTDNKSPVLTFNCLHCSREFRSKEWLEKHVQSLRCLNKQNTKNDVDASVPILELEDNFKIEYIAPHSDENMEEADQVPVDESISYAAKVSTNANTASFQECGSHFDDADTFASTVSGENHGHSECLEDTYSTVRNDKWEGNNLTSFEAGFQRILSDDDMEGNPPDLNFTNSRELCIKDDQIKQENVPTGDQEVQKIAITSVFSLPMQPVVKCDQPIRES